MRWITRLLLLTTTMSLALAVAAPILAQEAYTLRRSFKVNEIRRYKVVMDMSGEVVVGQNATPLNMQMVMVYREKVAGIKDGKATVHTTYESSKMFMNGQEFVMPNMPDVRDTIVTTIIDDRNRVHEVRGLERLQAGTPFGNMNFGAGLNTAALFPEEPVKIGDSWQADFPLPKAKELGLTMRHTLVSVTEVGGVRAAVIRTEFEAPYENLLKAVGATELLMLPPIKGTMKVVTNTYFDLATGNLLKSDGDMVMNVLFEGGSNNPMMPPQGMQMNISSKMSLTEVKDEKPASK